MSDPGPYAVAAEHVFDGVRLHARAAVMIERASIVAVVPQSELPADIAVCALPEAAWLAPGFIDLQVNGGADLLFNDDPSVPTISAIAAAHRKFGTTAFLPTLISDSPAKMQAALDAVQASIDTEPSVLGIHFEGPFLSPRKAGIHDVRAIRAPTPADLELLALPRKGEMLLTLAPEEVPPGFVARLARTGIRLSLGHSMATYAQTRQAMAEGMTGFTHLFNAMRPLESREPGPIAAALESPDAWYGLIVDGVHVDPAMLRLALRGAGHPMLVPGRRTTINLHALRSADHKSWRTLRQRQRNAGGQRSEHGRRGLQLRQAMRAHPAGGVALGVDQSGKLHRSWPRARAAGTWLSRRHGGLRAEQHQRPCDLGRRRPGA